MDAETDRGKRAGPGQDHRVEDRHLHVLINGMKALLLHFLFSQRECPIEVGGVDLTWTPTWVVPVVANANLPSGFSGSS